MCQVILNASDEIILDHLNKLQHGFDHVLQDNLHLMSEAGRDALRLQLTFMKSKIVTLEVVAEETKPYLQKQGILIHEHRECPKCKFTIVWGLYRNGVWSCTCDRCGHVETTTDRAASEKLWVVTEERESGIVDSETKGPDTETTVAGSETEG